MKKKRPATQSVFSEAYASCYDLLYTDKDYEAECQLLEHSFQRFSRRPVRHILDLGCGTGNHTWRLARRGYHMVGVDLSRPMLAIARKKSSLFSLPEQVSLPQFIQGDLRTLQLSQEFDAVLAMFAVLCYLPDEAALASAVATISRHLASGGLFLADVWYGPAVEAIKPEPREKIVETQEGRIIRRARSELIPERQLCLVHYRLILEDKNKPAREFQESHRMRYFFPEEVERFMDEAGLKLVHLCGFGDLERPPDSSTWNAMLIAQKP